MDPFAVVVVSIIMIVALLSDQYDGWGITLIITAASRKYVLHWITYRDSTRRNSSIGYTTYSIQLESSKSNAGLSSDPANPANPESYCIFATSLTTMIKAGV